MVRALSDSITTLAYIIRSRIEFYEREREREKGQSLGSSWLAVVCCCCHRGNDLERRLKKRSEFQKLVKIRLRERERENFLYSFVLY